LADSIGRYQTVAILDLQRTQTDKSVPGGTTFHALSEVSISTTFIQPLAEHLIALIDTPEICERHPVSVVPLGGVVFAAEEDTAPYPSDLASPIFAAAAVSEGPNQFLKQQTVVALAKLLRFAAAAPVRR
jgi:hypothetical protein